MHEKYQLRPALPRFPRLPDLLTTANLCCGTASILLSSQDELTIACWLLFLAAVFDVFDGLAARALGGGTPLGVQLDSLADMVSFGVAPAFALWTAALPLQPGGESWIAAAALCICIASAWRLAKFNVDTRQTSGFLGLPTPSNGLFWASMVLVVLGQDFPANAITGKLHAGVAAFLGSPLLVFTMALVLGLFMLSELPLPGLKFKHKGWNGNETIFLLIAAGVVGVLLFGLLAVPLLLVLYLLSPLWGKLFPKTR